MQKVVQGLIDTEYKLEEELKRVGSNKEDAKGCHKENMKVRLVARGFQKIYSPQSDSLTAL